MNLTETDTDASPVNQRSVAASRRHACEVQMVQLVMDESRTEKCESETDQTEERRRPRRRLVEQRGLNKNL